jgi:hypothetical protein
MLPPERFFNFHGHATTPGRLEIMHSAEHPEIMWGLGLDPDSATFIEAAPAGYAPEFAARCRGLDARR